MSAASAAANTNGVRPEDIMRVYDRLSLSLPLFISTHTDKSEEPLAVVGALILTALLIDRERFPRLRHAQHGAAHRANFLRLVGQLYDEVERA